jgi:hypothetical protein
MATMTEPTLRGNERTTAPEREAVPRAAEAAPAPEAPVYWGDWLAVRVWLIACVLMWSLLVLDFLTGFSRQ